jgi:hypothetical protein
VSRIELDPTGADVGTENPYQSNEPEEGNGTLSSDLLSRFGDARDGFGGCIVEGIPASCNIVISLLNRDVATIDPRVSPPAAVAEVAGGTAVWIADDTPTSVIDSGSQQDSEGNYTAHLTVGITSSGRFQVVGGGVPLGSQLSLRTVPQEAKPVYVPLKDINELRDLMQEALNYQRGPDSPKCKDAVAKIIEQLSKQTNEVHRDNTDVMALFNQLASDGNIRINVPRGEYPPGYGPTSGGSAFAFFEKGTGARKIWVYLMTGGYENTKNRVAAMPYEYAITGIHEIIHHMAKYTLYGEKAVNAAPKALGFGDISLDAYLKLHCIPREFW